MISNLSIIYIVRGFFASLWDFNSFGVKGNIFSFQNLLYFLRVLLKTCKTLSYSLFHDTKNAYFLSDQIPK